MPTTIKFARPASISPISHLTHHMGLVVDSVACLPQAIEAFFAGDRETLDGTRQDMRHLRGAAIRVLEELQDGLGRSKFLPVDRRDLLDVLQMQEAIADLAQDIIGLQLDLLPNAPRDLSRPVANLLAQGVAATGRVQQIVDSLEGILETGFSGPRLEATRGLIRSLVAVEEVADAGRREIATTLFTRCREMDPVSLVLFYRLLGRIGDLTVYSGKLALRARLLLVR